MIARYLILFFALIATAAQAATYDMTAGQYPPCNTSWNVTGTTYTCTGNGRVTLANSDTLTANAGITIAAANGFSLNNNVIGSSANNINLQSSYGTVVSAGSNTVYGNITAASGNITLSNTQVSGVITTGGHIVLTGGSVGGQVTSGSNTITTNGTDLLGGARAQSGMNITGGTLSGDFVMTSNNTATFSGVTMTDGSITGASTVNVTGNSTLGSGGSAIIISSNSGPITVTNGSTVYGNLTAPNWSTIHVNNGGAVYGICTPGSTPANACNEAPQGVAYYVLEHNGNGVTCEAEPITITAYNAEDEVVAPPAGTVLGLSTSPTGVWVGGNTYIFSGSETSIIRYLRQTSEGTLTLNASDGSASATPTQILFTDTALRFYGNRVDLDPIPHQVAGVEDPNPVLRIVHTDSETGACVARVQNRTLAVNLAFECQNPTSCVGGQTLSLAGMAVAPNNNGDTTNYSAINLNFDNAGFASIPMAYSDVGRVFLRGQLNLPAEGNDPAVSITGNSETFVVVPHRMEITSVPGNPGGGKPPSESCEASNGLGFLSAGSPFVLRVGVLNADDDLTPNFGWESIPEEIILNVVDVLYPSYTDRAMGSLTSDVGGPTRIVGGLFQFSEVIWSEVGSMRLSASILGNQYLGVEVDVPPDENFSPPSEVIGRFYVDHFLLSEDEPIDVVDACPVDEDDDGFTYMDHPQITVKYTLLAMNALGEPVSNYHIPESDLDKDYSEKEGWLCAADVIYSAENNNSGADLGDRLQVQEGFWAAGKWVINAEDAEFNTEEAAFERDVEEGPDGPFYSLQLGIAVEGDLDGAVLIDMDMDPTTTTTDDCADDNSCTAKILGDPLDLRYGRLNLASAYGPEVLDLPVRFATEFYNGVRWQRNELDNCTVISRSDINYPSGSIDNDANRTVNLLGGTTTGQYSGSSHPDDISFISGQVGHSFTAPGVSDSFQVRINLIDKPWLQFDWGDAYPDDVPGNELWGEYRFDSYHGHDRVIYWREVFN